MKTNNLHRTFWVNEYWYMALKWPIWLTNTKSFFRESQENVETIQKFSPYICVSYKFVLKSVKILNRISWATESSYKALKCQIRLTNTKPFLWQSKANVETLKNVFPILEFPINLFWSLSKDGIESFELRNIGSRL